MKGEKGRSACFPPKGLEKAGYTQTAVSVDDSRTTLMPRFLLVPSTLFAICSSGMFLRWSSPFLILAIS